MNLNHSELQQLLSSCRNQISFIAGCFCSDQSQVDSVCRKTEEDVEKNIGKVEKPSDFKGWASSLAVLESVDLRKSTFRNIPSEDAFYDEKEEQFASGTKISVTEEDRRKLIQKSLNKLTDQERTVVMMKMFTGMRVSDIARALDIPADEVTSLLNSAKKKINESKDAENSTAPGLLAPLPGLAYLLYQEALADGINGGVFAAAAGAKGIEASGYEAARYAFKETADITAKAVKAGTGAAHGISTAVKVIIAAAAAAGAGGGIAAYANANQEKQLAAQYAAAAQQSSEENLDKDYQEIYSIISIPSEIDYGDGTSAVNEISIEDGNAAYTVLNDSSDYTFEFYDSGILKSVSKKDGTLSMDFYETGIRKSYSRDEESYYEYMLEDGTPMKHYFI